VAYLSTTLSTHWNFDLTGQPGTFVLHHVVILPLVFAHVKGGDRFVALDLFITDLDVLLAPLRGAFFGEKRPAQV
jgi:hypothetical protein